MYLPKIYLYLTTETFIDGTILFIEVIADIFQVIISRTAT